MRNIGCIILGVGLLLALSGCFGKASTEEQIYDILEETVALEKPFVDQQENIAAAEKREKEIFEEISSLPSDQMDEIQALAEEAFEAIEKREGYIQAEKESMDASKKEFEKIPSLVEEIEDDTAKQEAQAVVEAMNLRYEEFDVLHTTYKETLAMEKELYSLLEAEDTEMSVVTDQLIDLNEHYEQVIESNKTFNEYTAQYNEQKQAFYKATELNITFEEN